MECSVLCCGNDTVIRSDLQKDNIFGGILREIRADQRPEAAGSADILAKAEVSGNMIGVSFFEHD